MLCSTLVRISDRAPDSGMQVDIHLVLIVSYGINPPFLWSPKTSLSIHSHTRLHCMLGNLPWLILTTWPKKL